MCAEQTTSLMQRKARTGREAHAARAMSLARALRLTVAKQAEQMMALAMVGVSVTRRDLRLDEMAACIDAAWLTMLMDGPHNRVAAVLLDPVLTTGLVQQQTMGKVMPAPEGGETRRHTSTDAAMCAPFIEGFLKRSAVLPEEEEDCDLINGYRFGVMAQEPRHAMLSLDASKYELVEMTLDMGAGVRTGKLRLILPHAVRVQPEVVDTGEQEAAPTIGTSLLGNVMELHAELSIALTQIKLPLKRVSAFKAGDIINLNISSMAEALVLDGNGVALSRGKLGQIDGVRALQVEQKLAKRHEQPRRRAADRDDLDLPDVTLSNDPPPLLAKSENVQVPALSDVDIFGDLDDLPDLPDMEELANAADAQMEDWNAQAEQSGEDAQQLKQAGW